MFAVFGGLIWAPVLLWAPAQASINRQINFQGKLTNPDGTNITDGSYSMRFRIYNHPTNDAANSCAANSCQWEETQGTVSVSDGIFRVALGSSNALPGSVDFNSSPLYLGVKVGSDAEMTPRIEFTATPYAFNSDMLDGLDSTAFGQLSSSQTWTGTNTLQPTTNIVSAIVKQTSVGSPTADILDVQTANGTNILQVTGPAANEAAVTLKSIGATRALTLDSGSGTLVFGANTTTLQKSGTAFTFDLNNASNSTLTVTNAGTGVASLSVEGDVNVGSGQVYKINGTQISSTALSNDSNLAKLNANQSYTGSNTFNEAAGVSLSVIATAAPTTDQLSITNTGFSVTTANVNAVSVNYFGGNAAVESAGIRVDYTPGGTSGGTWSGMRIVANSTGASSGVTSYGLKLEGPTSPGAGQETGLYVGTGWDIGLDVQSGGLRLAGAASEPNSPASGNLLIYSKDVAGRMLLKTKGPSGLDTPLQPALFFNAIAFSVPSTGATVTAVGMPNTTVGTASTPTISSTNLHTSMRRTTVTSAGTANSASELRSAQMLAWRGNAANLGGFFYTCRFAVNSTTANQRVFIGLLSSTAAIATNQNPSNLTNMIGVGWDSADTNLQIMGNNNAGTATKTDAGANFPANNTTAVYEFVMFAAPNGSSVGYRLTRLDTGAETSGSITNSADLPVNTNFLSHHEYMNNGGTAAAVVLDVMRVYVESDD